MGLSIIQVPQNPVFHVQALLLNQAKLVCNVTGKKVIGYTVVPTLNPAG